MDEPIAITVVPSTPLIFRLATASGGEVRVAQFIVSEASSGNPVWWIVSESWADAVSFRPMWVTVTRDADSESEEPPQFESTLDPIEDLPPSDPRHQAAIRGTVDPLEDLPASDPRHKDALRRLRIDTLALRQPLAVVTYGVVPRGFREVYPGSRTPQALSVSASYVAFVDCLIGESSIAFSA